MPKFSGNGYVHLPSQSFQANSFNISVMVVSWNDGVIFSFLDKGTPVLAAEVVAGHVQIVYGGALYLLQER